MSAKPWRQEPQRADVVLAALGLARSRTHAQTLIAQGKARADGFVIKKPGQQIATGAQLRVADADGYVSRAAHKLLAALDAFPLHPEGKLVLDLGASTGGFTQVLLQAGVREVIALDVGHSQLDSALRSNARVRVVEGCNARYLTPETLAKLSGTGELPELIVGDLSFISLRWILPAAERVLAPGGRVCLLIKPQFEVGPQGVKHGIVTDPRNRAAAVKQVIGVAAQHGFATRGLIQSPLAGSNGNREYLGFWERSAQPNPAQWYAQLETLTAA